MNTIVDQPIAQLVAKQLLKIHAVSINTKKPYRYVSGMLAPVYTDNRLLISHYPQWKIVLDAYRKVIRENLPHDADVLSGTATAAIPHAAALAYDLHMPMVYVRSSKKEHGKENQVEGEFVKGSNVLVIEDLVSTGKSIQVNVEAVRGIGGTVTHCLAITTSTLSAFEETVHNLHIELITLTNIQTVIEIAVLEKYISQKDGESVHLFLKDPKSWGHKMGFE